MYKVDRMTKISRYEVDGIMKEVRRESSNFHSYRKNLGLLNSILAEEFEKLGGYIEIEGRDAVFVGDVHGDLKTLYEILVDEEVLETVGKGRLVFLGDYIDRGPEQIEVLLFLSKLKFKYPEKVVLLRGNHEPPPGLEPYPHDFPWVLEKSYGRKEGEDGYRLAYEAFQNMPYALKLGDVLALHGGLPVKAETFPRYPTSDILKEVLWNDPIEVPEGYVPSPRGVGHLFSRKITERWMDNLKFEKLIRGHEPCEGYKLNHEDKVLTLFSRRGEPYFNEVAGIAILKEGSLRLKLF
jgi:protein phosphatase